MRWLLLALTLAFLGCHRVELIENVPVVTSLASFRTAGIVFARADAPTDKDDVLSAVHDAVLERIEGTKIFSSVADGTNAELLIRVVLLSVGDDQVTLGIELVNAKTNALVGRFQVGAQPDRKPPSTGGGIHVDFESKTSKAIDSAAREIASYLEDHR